MSNFVQFDWFMIGFTILVAIGVIRLMRSPNKTKFSLGFGSVVLLIFIGLDILMLMNWMGTLQSFQNAVFGG